MGRPFWRAAVFSQWLDQTRRYSIRQWLALSFSAAEIAEQAIGEKLELSE